MGIVWLAETSGPGGFTKRVVVKELRPELARDASYRRMFLEEARLAAKLRHRNIVQTHEVGSHEGRWFMVLEWLEGATLAEALPLVAMPLAARVRIVADVLAGLHHAHELRADDGAPLGVVHRDLSPRNVFLTVDGEVKLLDFGVAKCRDRGPETETQHGVLKGSVAYMTPDHVAGSTIDRRADVFAAGVLLRELLTGTRLWGDLPDVQILRRLIARDLPAFPASAPVPADLRAIAERAMARDRADRFPSADAMREALERWLADAPRAALAPVGASLARALAARERDAVELPSSALVTEVTEAPKPRSGVLGMALAGVLGIAAAASGATALLHDSLVIETETASVALPPIATVPLPVPPVVPSIAPSADEEPVVSTAAVDGAPTIGEAPRPYEPDSI